MTCFAQRHAWTRSSATSHLPQIEDGERCDCGMYTYGECRHYEARIAALEARLEAVGEAARGLEAAFGRWFIEAPADTPLGILRAALSSPDLSALLARREKERRVIELVRERHEDCQQHSDHKTWPRLAGPCLICEALEKLDAPGASRGRNESPAARHRVGGGLVTRYLLSRRVIVTGNAPD